MSRFRTLKHVSLKLTTGLLLIASLASCSGFYTQAAKGQLEILTKRRSIDRVIASPRTDAQTREKLALVQKIREFADKELKLDVGRNYGSYVDLERDSVVWNVMASPELSLEPKTWCYPIAGCVAYRGFFAEKNAERLKQELESKGYDVLMGGVDAYSTLGYLRDPVLNTFLDRGDALLASLLFHELAHAKFYLKGDTAFNEGFATAVEYAGLKRWLALSGDERIMEKFYDYDAANALFRELVSDARMELHQVYVSNKTNAEKRRLKAQAMVDLREKYEALKPQLNGISFDGWFEEDINNARLNSISTYEDYVPAFTELLSICAEDFDCFYARVKRLSKLNKGTRAKTMERLAQLADQRALANRASRSKQASK